MSHLPFIHSFATAAEELRQVDEVHELSLEAIRIHRLGKTNESPAWRSELESIVTRSSLLMAASIFEFALQQTAVAIDRKMAAQRSKEAAIFRYLKVISGVNDAPRTLEADDEERVRAFFLVRAMIAHTTGYQDRDFAPHQLELLARLGIRQAIQVIPPMFQAFYFEGKSVSKVVALFIRILGHAEPQQTEATRCSP